MPITVSRALAALALLVASPAHADESAVDWRIAPTASADKIQLTLTRDRPGRRSSNSTSIDATTLVVLAGDIARPASGPVRFRLVREAGSFSCSGTMREGRGDGSCSYARNADFDAALGRHGIARPTDEQSYHLASLDARIATVEALQRLGFPRPDVGALLSLTVHGADAPWLASIARAGRRQDRLADIVTYRIHGVTGTWLTGLIDAEPGLARAPAGDIIAMRIHGVTPVWVQGLKAAGLRNLGATELTAMRIHGITPEFARLALGKGTAPNSSSLIGRKLRGDASWH